MTAGGNPINGHPWGSKPQILSENDPEYKSKE